MVRLWCYNILGDNKGSISHLLKLDYITSGSDLLTYNLVVLKGEIYETIIIVKRTELRKFIDYFGLSIDTNPYNVEKLNIHLARIGPIQSTPYGNTHIARQQLEKGVIWNNQSYSCAN